MTVSFSPTTTTEDQLEKVLLGPPSAVPLSGDIVIHRNLSYKNEGATILSGTWQSAPGLSRWEFLDRGEFIYALSGHMTVTEDGGEPVEVKPGTAVVFPIGWKGTWEVHETFRKVFVVYK